MKKNRFTPLLVLLFMASGLVANAQKFAPIDPSPLDISYYPNGASMESKPALIKVIYSRPYKKGREIFGKPVIRCDLISFQVTSLFI